MTIGMEAAVWTDCPGSRMAFHPGFQVTIREIRNGFFNSTEYETLWAPLSAAGLMVFSLSSCGDTPCQSKKMMRIPVLFSITPLSQTLLFSQPLSPPPLQMGMFM